RKLCTLTFEVIHVIFRNGLEVDHTFDLGGGARGVEGHEEAIVFEGNPTALRTGTRIGGQLHPAALATASFAHLAAHENRFALVLGGGREHLAQGHHRGAGDGSAAFDDLTSGGGARGRSLGL